MANEPITSFNLPDKKTVDVHLVKLADGRTVVRTADELERKPVAPSPSTPTDPRRG